jgi:tripartite ATP-independent transporter DctM subunit
MVAILLICIAIFLLIGMPIAFSMGMGALLTLLWDGKLPLVLIPQKMFFGLDSWLLLAIPLFMLAGELMNLGGISKRLITFSSELFGFVRGSLGMITVAASMIFAAITGSSVACTAAVGSIMLPIMEEKGYNMRFATALQAAAGAIGPIIPPSLMMVLIGYLTHTSTVELFIGGVVPGIMIGIGLMAVMYLHAAKGGDAYLPANAAFSPKRVFITGIKALPGLGLPIIIIFGILGGIFTVTEAAVVGVAYGFIVGMFVYRELKLKDIPNMLFRSAELATIILFIVSATSLFGWLITVNQVPETLAKFMLAKVTSLYGFYVLYIILLIIVGMFMESFSASIVIIPLVFPLARSFGMDPVHFGVVTTVAWAIGYITPPFGVTLFVSCSLTGKSIREVTPYIFPIAASMLIVLLIITFFPQTFLWLAKSLK